MKKILLSLLAIELLITPTIGLADEALDPLKALDNIVRYAYGIFLTVAVICIIISAYYFVTSAGDPEKLNKAKSFLLYTLIGILVAFLVTGFIALVKKIAGV